MADEVKLFIGVIILVGIIGFVLCMVHQMVVYEKSMEKMYPVSYVIGLSNNVTITDFNCFNVGWADTVLRCDNGVYPNPISYKRVD